MKMLLARRTKVCLLMRSFFRPDSTLNIWNFGLKTFGAQSFPTCRRTVMKAATAMTIMIGRTITEML